MKKTFFLLIMAISVLGGSEVITYAETSPNSMEANPEDMSTEEVAPIIREPELTIPPTGELSSSCGANGNMNFYLYVSEENKNQITRIVFYDKNTGDEYFYKFNPVNYEDETLWVQHINIPQGDYFVSCRVSGDSYGRYSCSLYPEGELHIGDKLKSVICMVGTPEWIDNAYTGMEKAEAEATATPEPAVTPESPALEVTSAPKPTEAPLEKIEYIPQEAPAEEPHEKSPVPFYVFCGILAVAIIFLNTKKKKK